MEFENNILQLGGFFTVTIGIIVLFVGKRLNDAVGFLREFSIPEPVTGGLIFSLLIALLYALSGVEIEFGHEGRGRQKRRNVAIRKSADSCVPCAPSGPTPEKTVFCGDGGDAKLQPHSEKVRVTI